MLAKKYRLANNRFGAKLDGPNRGLQRVLGFSAARELGNLTYSRTLWQRVDAFFFRTAAWFEFYVWQTATPGRGLEQRPRVDFFWKRRRFEVTKPHRKVKKANHGKRPANAKARRAKRRKVRT